MRTTLHASLLLLTLSVFAQKDRINTIIQRGHNETVKSVAVSPNGKFLLTGSRDKSAKLWDWETGLEVHSFLGHGHTVNDVVFNKDGSLLATSSADNTAKIWTTQNHSLRWTSPKSTNYTTTIAFHPNKDWVAIGGFDWNLVVYNYKTGDSITSIKVAPDKGVGYGVQARFSLDGDKLIIGQDNRTASIYDCKDWTETQTFKPKAGWCGGCGTYTTLSPDGLQFTKLSNNDSVRTYDMKSGKEVHVYPLHLRDMAGISYNTEGDALVVANEDSVWILNVQSNSIKHRWHPDVKNINSVVFHPNGQVIIGTDDNKAFVYEQNGQFVRTFQGIQNMLDFSGNPYDANSYWDTHIVKHLKYRPKQILGPNNASIIEFGTGLTAYQWSLMDGKKKRSFIGHSKMVVCASMSADEKTLATGSANGELFLWDIKTGKLLQILKGHRDPIFDVRFSNNGAQLASTSWGGHVIIHNLEDQSIQSDIYLGNVAAYTLSFTKNDVYLILSKLDKTLELWEIDSKTKVKSFIGHTDQVSQIRTINSDQFLTSSKDGSLIAWNIPSGLIERKLKHPAGTSINTFAYQEQTGMIFTGGSDRKLYKWNANTGQLLNAQEIHHDELSSILLPQTEMAALVTRGLDGETKVWDKYTKERYARIALTPSDWMATTPSGHFYGTAEALNYVHYVNENTVFKPEQFFKEFFDPDLIQKAMSGVSQKRNLFDALRKSSPPRTQLVSLKDAGDSTGTILLRVIHQNGYKNIELFQNNKKLAIDWNSYPKKKFNDSTDQFKIPVKLVSGHNEFFALVRLKNDIESIPSPIDVLSSNAKPGSDCYVFAIGINTYKNPRLNLNYAHADASAFVDSMKANGGSLYHDIQTFELYDQRATKANILATLDSIILKASINDVVIIYYAGHGSMSEGSFYFVPTNATHLYEQNALQEEAVSAELLQEYLTKIKALKQVILIDACQSGGSVETLAMRGASEEKAIIQLSRSTGIHIFSAAESTQFAGEFSSLGHGLFTHVLLNGLSGNADGSPKDNHITIFELKSYLDRIVPDLSQQLKKSPQYPYTFSRGQDFPIITK